MLSNKDIFNAKLEQLKSINMTKSSGLTTVYGETNVQTEETIDDLRFK